MNVFCFLERGGRRGGGEGEGYGCVHTSGRCDYEHYFSAVMLVEASEGVGNAAHEMRRPVLHETLASGKSQACGSCKDTGRKRVFYRAHRCTHSWQ